MKNYPEPTIQLCEDFNVVGQFRTMTFEDDQTNALWRHFMPSVGQIESRASMDLISISVYPKAFFKSFSPKTAFEKWACVEVASFEDLPGTMSTMTVPGGLYAVFDYVGMPGNPDIFTYIFGTWVNKSRFMLGDRPHFELLGSKYKQGDPFSEEQIWVPIEPKILPSK